MVIKTLLYIGEHMENNQLYLIQLQRRLAQSIEEIKSLNNRLRNEDIEIQELLQATRMLDEAQRKLTTELRKQSK